MLTWLYRRLVMIQKKSQWTHFTCPESDWRCRNLSTASKQSSPPPLPAFRNSSHSAKQYHITLIPLQSMHFSFRIKIQDKNPLFCLQYFWGDKRGKRRALGNVVVLFQSGVKISGWWVYVRHVIHVTSTASRERDTSSWVLDTNQANVNNADRSSITLNEKMRWVSEFLRIQDRELR